MLFAALFLGSVARAQVSQNTSTTAVAADYTPVLLDPAIWAGQPLPGQWRNVSTVAERALRELTTLGPVFGAAPVSVQAYYQTGQLARIEVVWLEAGSFFGFRKSEELAYHDGDGSNRAKQQHDYLEARRDEIKTEGAKRKEFEAKFADYNQSLPTAITALVHTQPRSTSLGQTGALQIPVKEWTVGETVLRFTAQDHQLISLTVLPKADASRKLASNDAGADRRKQLAGAAQTLPNGDTVLSGVPMFDQGDRGYCAMGTLAMVTQYYGLNLNIDQFAAKAGYREGDTEHAKVIPVYQAAARELHLKFIDQSRLSFREAMSHVEKGEPILVWRWFSRDRDEMHRQFSLNFAAHPEAELPKPRREEQDTWPTSRSGGHASLITGFNKKRGEVLFTESWGEDNRNRRMRAEEMEKTVYAAFIFEP